MNEGIVDISEVPKKHEREGRWRDVFSAIPEGKAKTIPNEDYMSAYAILNYFRRKHKFKGYSVVNRTVNGKTVTYIIHKKPNGKGKDK